MARRNNNNSAVVTAEAAGASAPAPAVPAEVRSLRVGLYGKDKTLLYTIRYQSGAKEGFAAQSADKKWYQGAPVDKARDWALAFDRAVSACARHFARENDIALEKVAFTRGEAPASNRPAAFTARPLMPKKELDKLNPFRKK